MTLRRKMVNQIVAMVGALLLISAASLWGLYGLTAEFDAAVRGYEELRQVYDVQAHVRIAQRLTELSPMGALPAALELEQAQGKVERAAPRARDAQRDAQGGAGRKTVLRRSIRAGLEQAARLLQAAAEARERGSPRDPRDSRDADLREANAVMARVREQCTHLAAEVRQEIEEKKIDADRRRRATMLMMTGISLLVVLGVVGIGLLQYRSVIRPLRQLGDGVRTIAHGNFSNRVATDSYAEFAALAADFNRMADELEGLYRELEQKVAAKSRELVRSERLASVGYLAAGVAHEINNPIGIIAGFAELSLKELETKPGAESVGEAEKSLRVICEEAFRCKEIVAKLLALARPGDENRRVISLGTVARHVASMVEGLGEFRNRRVSVQTEPAERVQVLASEGEMKQVVLNLTLNALEATSQQPGGEVRLSVARRGEHVELSVEDNGKGMSPEVLDRVFEPFFTAKRGATQPGTGLGLSITHAIVEAHGGSMHVHSDGPGKGSRFTVSLPAAGGAESPGATASGNGSYLRGAGAS